MNTTKSPYVSCKQQKQMVRSYWTDQHLLVLWNSFKSVSTNIFINTITILFWGQVTYFLNHNTKLGGIWADRWVYMEVKTGENKIAMKNVQNGEGNHPAVIIFCFGIIYHQRYWEALTKWRIAWSFSEHWSLRCFFPPSPELVSH